MVSNVNAPDQGTLIKQGNQRVLNARLADAEFFYAQDQKKPLEDFLAPFKNTVFHVDLGSMHERVERLKQLAAALASLLGAEKNQAARAAMLCKADLATDMVGEFASLQGIMGYYYALGQQESPEIAEAIADHYKPKGPLDTLPRGQLGQIVALADKLDTLVGFFAIGIRPTGSKDPFALRRHALGIVRILELFPALSLPQLIELAYAAHQETINKEKCTSLEIVLQETATFLTDRAKVHWREQGLRYDCIEAVLKNQPLEALALQLKQIKAVNDLIQQQAGQDLVAVYRRAANIVRIEEEKDKIRYTGQVNSSSLQESQERHLFDQLQKALALIQTSLEQHDYRQAMSEVAALRPSIDQFFAHVTVNASEPHIRHNRLELLALIRSTLEKVAHFDKVEI